MNLIIVLLLLHYILSFKKRTNILGCGLFAFMGQYPSRFDWSAFNALGLYNDKRGGDSCGAVSFDFNMFGIRTLSDYSDMIEAYTTLPKLTSKAIIGHTRKASVGGVKEDLMQPYYLTTNAKVIKQQVKKDHDFAKWVNDNPTIVKREKGENRVLQLSTVYTAAHNGTIYNYEELAKKYNIVVGDKNDSHTFLELLYRRGFSIVQDYQGTAAFILYNYYKDEGYVFRGYSPYYENGTIGYDERPLYYWQNSKNSLYFSSLEDSLNFIRHEGEEVKELEKNVIHIIRNGRFVDGIEVDREHKSSQKRDTVKNYSGSKYFSNTDKWSNWDSVNGSEDNNYGRYSTGDVQKHTRETKNKKDFFGNKKAHFDHETDDPDYSLSKSRAYFCKGRYWMDKKLLEGKYMLNSFGYKPYSAQETVSEQYKEYYFIEGVMMYDKVCYMEAIKNVVKENDPKRKTAVLAGYSKYPVHTLNLDPEKDWGYQDVRAPYDPSTKAQVRYVTGFYNGSFTPMFSKRTYVVNDGDLVSIQENTRFEYGDTIKPITKPVVTRGSSENAADFFAGYSDAVTEGEELDMLNGVLKSSRESIDSLTDELKKLEEDSSDARKVKLLLKEIKEELSDEKYEL